MPDRPVAPDILHQVLSAACQAPSAGNLQSFRIALVQDADLRQRLRRTPTYYQRSVETAPVIIVMCACPKEAVDKYGTELGSAYALLDIGIAASHLVLAATEAGLGTCCIGGFEPSLIAVVLGLPPEWKPSLLVTLGYPQGAGNPLEKRGPADLVQVAQGGQLRRYQEPTLRSNPQAP